MADLKTNFAGIRSPNPFWLASAPPTNSGAQIHRAFEAGWGGAVWKTIGAPVLNVSNRYGTWRYGNEKMLAINNVELISDRPMEVNLREIAEVKRAWPDRAVIGRLPAARRLVRRGDDRFVRHRVLSPLVFCAGTGAERTIGTGLNVNAIRKAPSPMIHEPI